MVELDGHAEVPVDLPVAVLDPELGLRSGVGSVSRVEGSERLQDEVLNEVAVVKLSPVVKELDCEGLEPVVVLHLNHIKIKKFESKKRKIIKIGS